MQLNLWSPLKASSRAESPEEKEKVIIVLGLTGSGKSTFINAAAGSPRIPVGHGLESATRSVCTTYITDPTSSCSKILLAEAPAFTYEMESIRESERQLRKWVDNTLSTKKHKILGILYLGKISEPRMTISPFIHLELFEQLLGRQFNAKIHLATTMWDRTLRAKALCREEELKNSQWRPLLAAGAAYYQFDGSSTSATSIVRKIITIGSLPPSRTSLQTRPPPTFRYRLLSLFRATPPNPPKPNDGVFIAVMGLSGTGKSSFVNAASGHADSVDVGHGLVPCTTQIKAVCVSCPLRCDEDVFLIDTPGWDLLNCPDPGGIKAISQELYSKDRHGPTFGLLYLHRIATNRASEAPFEEILKFMRAAKLVKKSGDIPPTAIASTMWDEVEEGEGLGRHQALEECHNRPLLRHQNDLESAWRVMDTFVQRSNSNFARNFSTESDQLIANLRASSKADIAGDIERLGSNLSQLVVDIRSPAKYHDVSNLVTEYERRRLELCDILGRLEGYKIGEYVWKRARLQIQVE